MPCPSSIASRRRTRSSAVARTPPASGSPPRHPSPHSAPPVRRPPSLRLGKSRASPSVRDDHHRKPCRCSSGVCPRTVGRCGERAPYRSSGACHPQTRSSEASRIPPPSGCSSRRRPAHAARPLRPGRRVRRSLDVTPTAAPHARAHARSTAVPRVSPERTTRPRTRYRGPLCRRRRSSPGPIARPPRLYVP